MPACTPDSRTYTSCPFMNLPISAHVVQDGEGEAHEGESAEGEDGMYHLQVSTFNHLAILK